MNQFISLVVVLLLAFLITCGGGGFRQLIGLTVQPNVADGNAEFAGHWTQFSAAGTYDHEPFTQANVTAQWAAIDPNIADIGASTGMARCLIVGSTVITRAQPGKGAKSRVRQLSIATLSGTVSCPPEPILCRAIA
jgi:hypothetical protein